MRIFGSGFPIEDTAPQAPSVCVSSAGSTPRYCNETARGVWNRKSLTCAYIKSHGGWTTTLAVCVVLRGNCTLLEFQSLIFNTLFHQNLAAVVISLLVVSASFGAALTRIGVGCVCETYCSSCCSAPSCTNARVESGLRSVVP